MAWIELHQSVWTHRKTLRLAATLGLEDTHAAAHVLRLWTWALDNAPHGLLGDLPPEIIAAGAGWRGDAVAFVAALHTAGYLEQTEAGITIHDWQDYAGRLITQREHAKHRTRAWRDARNPRKTVPAPENDTHNERITYASSRARLTQPNPTVPDHDPPPNPPQVSEPATPASVAPAKPVRYTPDFEAFWKAYPHEDGRAWPKPIAYVEWRKLMPERSGPAPATVEHIMRGVAAWTLGRDWRRGRIMRPDRWLQQRCFDDPPTPWSGRDEQPAPVDAPPLDPAKYTGNGKYARIFNRPPVGERAPP